MRTVTRGCDDSRLDPLRWAELALGARSIDEAHARIMGDLGRFIHVSSLLITVDLRLPSSRASAETAGPMWGDTAGILVNEEWTDFLVAGHYQDDPMTNRLARTRRPIVWWEESPLHRSMDDVERRFAQHYLEHEIRLGMLDGALNGRCGRADIVAFDSKATFREFHEFDRVHSDLLHGAVAWLFEGLRARSMKTSETPVRLTPREHECLAWTSEGLSSPEISERLNLSRTTVDEHIASATRRLGAQTRVQACARATLIGLI